MVLATNNYFPETIQNGIYCTFIRVNRKSAA